MKQMRVSRSTVTFYKPIKRLLKAIAKNFDMKRPVLCALQINKFYKTRLGENRENEEIKTNNAALLGNLLTDFFLLQLFQSLLFFSEKYNDGGFELGTPLPERCLG